MDGLRDLTMAKRDEVFGAERGVVLTKFNNDPALADATLHRFLLTEFLNRQR